MIILEVFTEYYIAYRGDNVVPDTTDPEWGIAMGLANMAIHRWSGVDGVLWDQLWANLAVAADGVKIIASNTKTYAAPTDMKQPAQGFLQLTSSQGGTFWLPLLNPIDVQAQDPSSQFAYFTGDPNHGYVLNLNVVPDSSMVGAVINYIYQKKATKINVTTETGTTNVEMLDPYFMVHDMLKNRFRASRNWPAYQTAKTDADDALSAMIVRNFGQTPYMGPGVSEAFSGGVFGQ